MHRMTTHLRCSVPPRDPSLLRHLDPLLTAMRSLILADSPPRRSSRTAAPRPRPPFRVEETTIAQIHEAMKAGRLTCRALVDTYLRRIDAYDKNGPGSTPSWSINPRCAEAGRRPRSRVRAVRTDRAAALHSRDREGQLRDDRPAERRRARCRSRASSRTRTPSRSSASRTPAPSCSPSRTWRSSPSARTKP